MAELNPEERQGTSTSIFNPNLREQLRNIQILNPEMDKEKITKFGLNLFGVFVALAFTWLFFWAMLSWDQVSKYYGRDSWSSFTASSLGVDGSLRERAKAATLFILLSFGLFFTSYGLFMAWRTWKTGPAGYITLAAVGGISLLIVLITVGTGVLTT
jgi:hypothetical protein